MPENIKPFLNEEGKIIVWPSKLAKKLGVLSYLADKFEEGRDYSEKEVNAIIDEWHTFGDYFMLRRGMVDYKLLNRTSDGSRYWKGEKEAVVPDDPKCLCAALYVETQDKKEEK